MATDLQKLFDEISNGLDLMQPRQVEIVAKHVYRDKVTPLIKEALEDYEDRQDSDVDNTSVSRQYPPNPVVNL